jgi:alpha-L-rhamnosidase
MLNGWLEDLAIEQAQRGGVPPVVVPDVLDKLFPGLSRGLAIWGDVCVLTPLDLFEASGDIDILTRQYQSMSSWIDKGIRRKDDGLWAGEGDQLGDWLDPAAPYVSIPRTH